MKQTKTALHHSLIALLLCIVMLISSTFAWFTDSVSSGKNIITVGNLDLEMYWTDNLDSGVWHNVEENGHNTIFSYDNWEPGYTDVKYVKLVNAGSLALNYQLTLTPENGVGKLAEVINVYFAEGGVAVKQRADLINLRAIGLLDNVLNGGATADGTLLAKDQYSPLHPSGEVIMTVAMNMLTTAGNEYMNEDAGTFSITALATQAPFESDSFGNDYDSNAEYPAIINGTSVKVPVTPVDGKIPAGGVTLSKDGVSAFVPEGALVKDGVTELEFKVTPLKNTTSDIITVNNEILIPVDVHIEGLADNNTIPAIIDLGEVLPKYLNMGNYRLFHVEDGTNNEMTLVDDASALTTHNSFTYDPLTGKVVVAMASFSEVALVADTSSPWNGKYDYTWYDASKTSFEIANADQFAAFGKIVGGMAEGISKDTFENDTITLLCDVNLKDGEADNDTSKIIYPVGYYNYLNGDENSKVYVVNRTNEPTDYETVVSNVSAFKGTFDGNGHTIKNIYQNTWEMFGDYNSGYPAKSNYYKDAMGLFGYVDGAIIKNLTIDNFKSDGEFTPTGVIAAFADNSTFENIAITNCNPRVYNTGNGGIVGIAGESDTNVQQNLVFNNITVDKTNKITALWGSWDVACGGIVGMYRGDKSDTVSFTNCHVAAQIDVFNDVCGNYQYYWYRYAGMMIGTINNMKQEGGYTVPDLSGISATSCTVRFDEWNDYYYCELVANSLASYTHDHQFSRLTQISTLDEIKSGDTWTKVGNFLLISGDTKTCYHIVNKDGTLTQHLHTDAGKETVNNENVLKEDKQIVYLPFNQLFTGYGWGVKHVPITGDEGSNVKDQGYPNLDIKILERQGTSEVKFESKFTGDFLYRVGNQNTVTLGTLFTEKVADSVIDSGVWVTVEKVDDSMTVGGKFTADKNNWENGTIQFSGTGVVKVTVQDYNYCTPTVLYLEVVDAYNRTTASFSGNSVLLNDVTTSNTLSTSGVIYGNGFTVNMENAPISEKNGAVFHLYDGAILKNLGIVGKEFTTVAMNVNDTNYGVSAVRAWGTVTIENCYISGCRSAVSVTGTELTIKDSVIANGVYSNVDFRSGILNLHNVTTINEPHTVNGTTIVGLGIVGNMTASAGRKINITGNLTQYNWLSQADCNNIKASGVNSIFNSVFTDDKYSSIRYTYNGTTYVNTGILSLCSDFGKDSTTGIPSSYSGMDVTATISNVSVDGYVWAPAQAGTLTADNMKYHDAIYAWTANDQGSSYIPPAFDFASASLESENGVVQVSYESGSSYTLTTDKLAVLLAPKKYGKNLTYTIAKDGELINEDIVLDDTASKTYTITYTITDDIVYNKAGALTTMTYKISKDLKVFATVVDKGADAPTFTFYYGTNGSASAGTPHTTQPTNSYTSTIKQVGEEYYIMPNVSSTTANAIGSQTVNGDTIYYPIVDGINVRSGNSMDYDFTRYYPVFKAVKISDNGTDYTYSGTKEMPDTVAWVSATIDSGNSASALNDGFGLYNNQYLCKIQKKAGDAESGGTPVVKYSYTALDGNTYYYYVGYRFYDENEGCITEGTLITMADGTQKPVEEINIGDMVLAFNHESGKFVPTPVIFNTHVNNLEPAEYEVLNLEFSNGKELEIVESHGLFDMTLMKYVYINYDNYKEFIGHKFYYAGADGKSSESVTLVKAYVETELTRIFCPVTYFNMNSIANGFLNAPNSPYGIAGPVNYFDYDSDLKYNEESMKRDIEKYGLYTYDDFREYMTEEAYNSSTAVYLKIAEAKGLITYEEIIIVINYLLEGSLIK